MNRNIDNLVTATSSDPTTNKGSSSQIIYRRMMELKINNGNQEGNTRTHDREKQGERAREDEEQGRGETRKRQ